MSNLSVIYKDYLSNSHIIIGNPENTENFKNLPKVTDESKNSFLLCFYYLKNFVSLEASIYFLSKKAPSLVTYLNIWVLSAFRLKQLH